jgi:hypothetical protein
LSELKLPAKPRIVKVDWGYYEESTGDETLEVHVVFEDRTTDAEISNAPIFEIKRGIMDRLEQCHVDLFPYFVFERESEHEPPIREE